MRALVVTVAALFAACASETPEAPLSSDVILLSTIEQASQDRQVVATVQGKAVYSDCVEQQARAGGMAREAALQECIDFELLAQAAESRGYLAREEVQAKGKQELVRAFLTARYPLQGPEDLNASLVRALWDQINIPRYNHPALRNVVFCLIPLKKDVGPENSQYQAAEAFFLKLYAELKDRVDLKKDDLYAPCFERYKENGVTNLKLHTARLLPRSLMEKSWGDLAFDGGRKVGQVLPPIRGNEGWALILLTEAKEALTTSFAEAEQELRDALFTESVYQVQRDQLFATWFKPIAAQYKIQHFPERLPSSEPILSLGETGPTP